MENERVVTFAPGRGWFWMYLGTVAMKAYWKSLKTAFLLGLAIGLGIGYWLAMAVVSHRI